MSSRKRGRERERRLRVSPVRIYRRERHGRHARCKGDVAGMLDEREGWSKMENARQGEAEGSSGKERDRERESREGRSETSESFGVGSGAAEG